MEKDGTHHQRDVRVMGSVDAVLHDQRVQESTTSVHRDLQRASSLEPPSPPCVALWNRLTRHIHAHGSSKLSSKVQEAVAPALCSCSAAHPSWRVRACYDAQGGLFEEGGRLRAKRRRTSAKA